MKEEILKKIAEAFINEPYIGDENIVYNNSEDHFECYELKKQFIGVKWEDVSKELIFENKDYLPFLSAEGFKYYLPAFMNYIISDFYDSDTLADNVIDLLTLPVEEDSIDMAQNIKMYELDKKIPEFDFEGFLYDQVEDIDERVKDFLHKVSLFNNSQKKVISDFLKYLNENHAEDFIYNPVKPINALERFWLKLQ